MYDVIKQIIDHVWSTTSQTSTEQQTIYYIAGACIIIMTIWALDCVRSIFHWR